MSWVFLVLAGIGEICFVIFMKMSDGFTKHHFTFLTSISAFFSFYFLSKAVVDIPIGTGYGIWTGIGAAGSVLLGMLFFKESKNWKRIMFIGLIISGVIGLKIIG